ncbi:succinate-semialdehyde dehydrogenase (NADP(+)) [Rhodoblastus sphagnicola]|uniref:Succinate-semialdehyde dehydrogenase (NADP(+)) n=1 Tax=Rhodoblastus sphagnicola TaxID=333368 RepID=A0A2S6ND57_9HYPH|nr:NAD-dependent succinate-semialdehyde dehydrogenase [Rhodoblastus sphagnicola]MBB4197998.1 succinate-semialdehyde dehydrogenase/glutarate-semialdehyde dehydrogenase [Rhodoblastus sphagnicola]PPQ32565.1 succinate-semialdehyde dehydrogenase (NADP(+)) [Rhodoblastus sphagnicola]
MNQPITPPLALRDQSLLRESAYVAGAWTQGEARFAVKNPATGALIGHVPLLGAAETRHAIESAAAAFADWRKRSGRERGALLLRWRDLILENTEDLAWIMTTEQGKPLAEARGEVGYAASFLEWFAEEAKRVYGETVPSPLSDRRLIVSREPIGVCAAITPWNFPLAMITRKAGPALAVGCPMIVKPAEATPFSALALAVLAERAGIPGGVFQVVTGDPRAIGGELTSNPTVRKLSFTGSTQTGKLLYAQCAPTVKKLSLELGGNAPYIVFDDADLDAAVTGAIASKFRNSGQTCVCANRFYVQDKIYDAFAEKFAQAVNKLVVGEGFAPGVTQGPLINAAAIARVTAHVADAVEKGGRILTGGAPHPAGANFFAPTVIADAKADMRVAKEEIFGPVAPVFRFSDEAEVIRLANDTEYGLAAYFFARDLARVWRVAEALEYGMVAINTGAFSNEVAPFGGVKQSGFGREGSRLGVDEYLVVKMLAMAGL